MFQHKLFFIAVYKVKGFDYIPYVKKVARNVTCVESFRKLLLLFFNFFTLISLKKTLSKLQVFNDLFGNKLREERDFTANNV